MIYVLRRNKEIDNILTTIIKEQLAFFAFMHKKFW